jgi:hypothetical protein
LVPAFAGTKGLGELPRVSRCDSVSDYSICSTAFSSLCSGAGCASGSAERRRRVVPVLALPSVLARRVDVRLATGRAAVRRVVPDFAAVRRVPVARVPVARVPVPRVPVARDAVLRAVVLRAPVALRVVLRVPVRLDAARVDAPRVAPPRVPVARAAGLRPAVLRVVAFFAPIPRLVAVLRAPPRVPVLAAPRVVVRFVAVLRVPVPRVPAPRVPVPRVVLVEALRVVDRMAIGCARGASVLLSSLTGRNSFSGLTANARQTNGRPCNPGPPISAPSRFAEPKVCGVGL